MSGPLHHTSSDGERDDDDADEDDDLNDADPEVLFPLLRRCCTSVVPCDFHVQLMPLPACCESVLLEQDEG